MEQIPKEEPKAVSESTHTEQKRPLQQMGSSEEDVISGEDR